MKKKERLPDELLKKITQLIELNFNFFNEQIDQWLNCELNERNY